MFARALGAQGQVQKVVPEARETIGDGDTSAASTTEGFSRRLNDLYTASDNIRQQQDSGLVDSGENINVTQASVNPSREVRSTREQIKAKLNGTIAATKDKVKEKVKLKLNDTISAAKDKIKGNVGISKAVDKVKTKIEDKAKEKIKAKTKKEVNKS